MSFKLHLSKDTLYITPYRGSLNIFALKLKKTDKFQPWKLISSACSISFIFYFSQTKGCLILLRPGQKLSTSRNFSGKNALKI